jgi:hypothetical protein
MRMALTAADFDDYPTSVDYWPLFIVVSILRKTIPAIIINMPKLCTIAILSLNTILKRTVLYKEASTRKVGIIP